MPATAPDFRRLLGPNEVAVAGSVVTPREQATLVAWVEEQRARDGLLANPRNPGTWQTPFFATDRRLTRLTRDAPPDGEWRPRWVPDAVAARRLSLPPEELWDIRDRVVDLLGLQDLDEDHYKGTFLAHIAPGGAIHEHRDSRLDLDGTEYRILRANVLFSRTDGGGDPVIGGCEIPVPARGMWAFYASEQVHSASVVVGDAGGRGTLSYGFLVAPAALPRRAFRVNPAVTLPHDASDLSNMPRHEVVTRRLIRLLAATAGELTPLDAAEAVAEDPAIVADEFERLHGLGVLESVSGDNPAMSTFVLPTVN